MSTKSPTNSSGAQPPDTHVLVGGQRPILNPAPTPKDFDSLVQAVVEAHEKHKEALKNGTSFTANPSPQLSPHHGPGDGKGVIPPFSPASTSGGQELRSDDARSASASVGEPALVSIRHTNNNKSQGDISDTPVSVPGGNNSRSSFDYSDPIVELGKAATELYLALGGADHKHNAKNLLFALERTLELVKDSAALLKSMNLVPMADVVKYAEKFVHLMADAKELFMASQASGSPSGRSELLTPPYSGVHPLSPVRRENTAQGTAGSAFGDRKVLALGQPQPPAGAPLRPPTVIAEDELYDVTLLVKGAGAKSPGTAGGVSPGGQSGGGRDPEVDDEMLALKSRIQSLSLQKKQLESHVERLEIQLKKQADSVSKEAQALKEQHLEMEKDLQWMQTQVEKGLWLPTYAAGSPARRAHGGGSGSQATSPQRVHSNDNATGGNSPLTDSGAAPTDAPSPAHHLPMIAPNDVASFRANKLDVLYADTYRGRGMEMVWNVLECVYKREYSGNGSSPTATGSPRSNNGNNDTATAGGGDVSPPAAKIGTPNDRGALSPGAYQNFISAYRRKIGDILEDQTKFTAQIVETTPLRSDYVANCLSNKLKPNSGVVKLLTTITSDESVEVLNLHSNYIGDSGLAAVIPLLTRLYRLRELNLSDNGLKNGAIHQLCGALQRHPTIERVNVSNNPITRSGGKDLLTLASSCSNVVEVNCTGTQIEAILQERIVHRTQLNQDATKR